MSTEATPPPSTHHHGQRAPVLAVGASAVLATAVALSGVRGHGHRLVRDFVAVPDPAAPASLLPATATELRAWPLDAVTWALSSVVPTAVQQVALIVACLLLAGVGTGLLAARTFGVAGRTAAGASAAWLAVWNPYVLERLLLGQVATLLGYACLPWVVLVARSRLGTPRRLLLVVLVALPAALTPWGGIVAAVAAVLADLSRPDRHWGRAAVVAGLGLAWCLPWLVPALMVGGVAADPDGPAAFALDDDSGLGTWVSALMGGGVWASGAQPPSRTDPVSLAGSLALVALAVVVVGGIVALGRSAGGTWAEPSDTSGCPREAPDRAPGWRTAVVLGVLLIGPPTLAWWASGPGLDVMAALQQVPGVALFRDQHRMLAPAVLAQAVLVSLAVGWLVGHGGRLAAALGYAFVAAVAVAAVPDLPGHTGEAYRAVSYPAEWDAVVRSLDGGTTPSTVVSLPWQPLRRPAWAGEPAFLDPLPRAVTGEVLVSTTLTVQRDGRAVVVDDAPIGEDWASGEISAASLDRHDVTHVVEWLDSPGALAADRTGWRTVHTGTSFSVWDVTGAR